jgi:hypothetical protein
MSASCSTSGPPNWSKTIAFMMTPSSRHQKCGWTHNQHNSNHVASQLFPDDGGEGSLPVPQIAQDLVITSGKNKR